jgi:5-methylcytosine-specific restriction endonuclease McrA
VCHTDKGTFDIHHTTYERVGAEKEEDVQVLCRPCHKATHGKMVAA